MPEDFALRVATPADAAVVAEVLRAAYPRLMRGSYPESVLAPALPLMTKANPALLSAGTYYLAVTGDGRVVGCGGWSPARPDGGEVTPGLAHIRHFATHPDWTRRGIGRALYARCADAARRQGATCFECYASLNSQRFYAALGFAACRRVEVPLAPELAFPAVLMRCTLAEA